MKLARFIKRFKARSWRVVTPQLMGRAVRRTSPIAKFASTLSIVVALALGCRAGDEAPPPTADTVGVEPATTPSSVPAAELQTPATPPPPVPIPTTLRATQDYYPWITALSSGPVQWTSDEETEISRGLAYRVVVLTSEIYDTVLLEEITLGNEGCCVALGTVRELDLRALADHFGLRGEMSGFRLTRWMGPDSFEFQLHRRTFGVDALGADSVKVHEVI